MIQEKKTQVESIFTFPSFASKKQLTTFYNVSADKLKEFLEVLAPEVMQEIDWASTRTFGPKQTHEIYLALSPAIYPKVVEARVQLIVEASIKEFKNVA